MMRRITISATIKNDLKRIIYINIFDLFSKYTVDRYFNERHILDYFYLIISRIYIISNTIEKKKLYHLSLIYIVSHPSWKKYYPQHKLINMLY